MKKNTKILKRLYSFSVVLFLVGILDPLEGSIAILLGSGLMALSTFLNQDRHRKVFLFTFLSIVFGVFFLFYLSELGGFGGGSGLSWWWGLLILPYPIAWVINVVVLIKRLIYNRKSRQKRQ